jgi:hypothetical protein
MTAISFGELSSKLNRRFPNEATLVGKTDESLAQHISQVKASGGSETSQYLEENILFP